MDEIRNNPLYNTLPCITKDKNWYLHASYDNLEIRVKFAEFLQKLDGFEFYCAIGRKRLDNENVFYQILLSARRKNSQHKLKTAIENAIVSDNSQREIPLDIKFNCEIVRSEETPEICIVDYMLWSIQRYLLKGEMRFYKALESKYKLIIDLYKDNDENPQYYDSLNKLDLEKVEEFKTDGYI